ncbi:MAG: type II toxin-antitoxin system RelE/ParE family toxin [Geobacteraceae bacterium]|nr:type II toxin-antitoxin system RelE/ParE family toxin [Geobacteraceae bacterium]
MFCCRQRIIILHAFIKKTQATPEQELENARKRLKEVQNGRVEISTGTS